MCIRDRYEKALTICISSFGEENVSTATVYDGLGCVLTATGDYNSALYHHEKALEIFNKVFGEGHPSSAEVYAHIGQCYKHLGNREKALMILERALDVYVRNYGEHHRFCQVVRDEITQLR
eukprot:TRINITY_DN20403_c0_g1_i2.p1 TRINITY_DN20403_c0_g1~~TRINITY_DN20403_c0_g1_i2.p1  ORF type:complete len:140 (-),score=23.08 TRINITY_DN20403_c0_g1_i2:90-452(-)